MRTLWRLASVVLALALGSESARAVEVRDRRPCMGTELRITIDARNAAQGRALLDAAYREAARLDGVLSNWRSDSEVSRFNALAGHGAVRISPDLAGVLAVAARLRDETDGAFDVTLGPVIQLLRQHVSDPAALSRARALADPHGMVLDGPTAALARPGMAVDLGGIGKGYTMDRLRDLLAAGGARSGFIEFGRGTSLAFGVRPRRIRLTTLSGARGPRLELAGAARSTSSSGLTESRVVDPRSGARVPPRRQATVVATSAAVADAWTKPLVVLGRAWLLGPGRFRLPGRVHYEDAEGTLDLDPADLLGAPPPGHGAP